jgi:hypothetical protein
MLPKTPAALVSILLASCTSLSKGGRDVVVVGSKDAVVNCKPLGHVSARTGFQGIASVLAHDRLDTQLRNKVARKGGNYLLLEEKHAAVNEESHASGTAYSCGPST